VYGVDLGTGSGYATYHYFDDAGAKQTQYIANVDGLVLRAQQDIGVLGTVKGQTTLVSDVGFDIYPVGDLVYDGFTPDLPAYTDYDNTNNYGVGDHNNVIALASGGDIFFEQVQRRWDNGTQALVPVDAADTDLFLTAYLIANEEGHGMWWQSRDGTRHGDIEINKYEYNLRAIGARTINEWFSYDAGGVKSNEMIRFFFDTRFSDGLNPPGVPLVQSNQDGDILLVFNGDWSEQNIPL
jgi:hypothetical protein